MPTGDENIQALRDASRLSPDNLPLRLLLASTLLSLGRLGEAEQAYREALAMAPHDHRFKIGLASAFFQQGKNSHALVIVEELLKRADTPAAAYLLHARLLIRSGHIDRAVRQYKQAVECDPAVADSILEEQLGLGAADDASDLVDGRLRATNDDAGSRPDTPIEKPRLSFDDVGGMDDLKEEIRMKIIHPLNHPEIYKAYGKPIGGGILMYGPPGCGKTHLARATAGQIQAAFISVGINQVLDMWIGSSERNLHEVFDEARTHQPCVLFFDEVDALGASRSDMRQSAGRHLINQFLAELDGVQSSNEGVLVLGATNAPWHLDAAFRRPGRFDRILFVPPPDAAARAAILQVQLRAKPADNIDFDYLGKKTEGFSGADLKAVVDLAIEAKLREVMKTGRPTPITNKDLLAAAKNSRPSTLEWFSTARNYALYSNQAGLYDDILKHLKLT